MKKLCLIFILTFFSVAIFAQKPAEGCGENSADDRNPLVVAVYNFVPDSAAKTANLREILKSSDSFTQTLEADQSLRVLDNRIQVMPAELGLDVPEITDTLNPPPAASGASYYFTGKIGKTNDGFLLTVDLKNAKDNTLVNEQKIPFASDSQATQTGASAAAAMQKILATLALAERKKRDTGDNVAISPRLNLVLDKEKVKPNEIAKVKINLVDCDGKPLPDRTVNVTVKTDFSPPVSLSNDLKTDALGSISDSAGASRPTVLRYTAVYKYKDLNGSEQTVSASQPLIVGSVKGYWLLYVEFYYNINLYNKILDEPTPWNLYGRYRDITGGSLNIILKAETNEYGTVGKEVISYDGYIFRSHKGDTTISESGIVQRSNSQTLNTTDDGIASFESGFQIDLENKIFSGSIASLPLKGFWRQQQITCFGPGACGNKTFDGVEESNIAHELGGIGCQADLTPAMLSGGVFKCSFKESEDLTRKNSHESTLGMKSLEIKVALRSLEDTYLTIKKK
jgi:hypothetical protein